jgi:hypothetical protein
MMKLATEWRGGHEGVIAMRSIANSTRKPGTGLARIAPHVAGIAPCGDLGAAPRLTYFRPPLLNHRWRVKTHESTEIAAPDARGRIGGGSGDSPSKQE